MIQKEKYDNEYLEVIPLNKSLNSDTYDYKVLTQNVLEHFIKIGTREVDNQTEIVFSIKNKGTLDEYLNSKGFTEESLDELFRQLFEALSELEEYMLEASCLYLDVEAILIDEGGKLLFLAIPDNNGELSKELQKLIGQLIGYVSNKNNKKIFKYYKFLLNNSPSINDIKTYFSEESKQTNLSKNIEVNHACTIDNEKQEIDVIFENEEKEQDGINNSSFWKNIIVGIVGAVAFLVALGLKMLGYLPYISVEKILGIILILMSIILFITTISSSIKNKKQKKSKRNKSKDDKEQKDIEEESKPLPINCENYKIYEEDIGHSSENIFKSFVQNDRISKDDKSMTFQGCSINTVTKKIVQESTIDYGVLISQNANKSEDIYFRGQNLVIGSMTDIIQDYVTVANLERLHCRIYQKENLIYIEKLSKSAVVKVNDVEIQPKVPCELVSYDQLQIGNGLYIFIVIMKEDK